MINTTIRKIISFASLGIILILLMLLLPQSIGLGREGFDVSSILNQFFFYGLSTGFLLGLLFVFVYELVINKDDSLYGDNIGFSSPGDYPSLSIFKRFSNLQIGFLSVIIFSTLGLMATVLKGEMFADVKILAVEQQFTAVDSIVYSSLLIPIAENLGLAFLIAFVIWGLRYLARKNNWGKYNFMFISILSCAIIGGLYGLFNHLLRYGGQETSLLVVLFFWAIGGLLTVLSGSFIPFWIMHLMNNLFFDIKRFYSSEYIIIFSVISIIIIIAIYFFLYRNKLFGSKQTESPINI